jgi:hypothetical protein
MPREVVSASAAKITVWRYCGPLRRPSKRIVALPGRVPQGVCGYVPQGLRLADRWRRGPVMRRQRDLRATPNGRCGRQRRRQQRKQLLDISSAHPSLRPGSQNQVGARHQAVSRVGPQLIERDRAELLVVLRDEPIVSGMRGCGARVGCGSELRSAPATEANEQQRRAHDDHDNDGRTNRDKKFPGLHREARQFA